MKAGFDFTAFTLAIASRKVPSASGLAGLLKPIWLSLICRKVKPDASAANASPSSPTDFGTPPDNAQARPYPPKSCIRGHPGDPLQGPVTFAFWRYSCLSPSRWQLLLHEGDR